MRARERVGFDGEAWKERSETEEGSNCALPGRLQ